MVAVIRFAADCLQRRRRLKQQQQHCIDSQAVDVGVAVSTVVAADGNYGLEIDGAERLQPVVNLWRRRIGLGSPSIGSEGVEVGAGIDKSHGNSDLS